MNNDAPSMLKATLIGGALFGFVGGLPLIGAINACCCLLVVAGGFLAAYLYSKECSAQGVEFGAGSGAMVGLVAGLFYAATTVVVGGLVQLAMGADIEQAIEQIEDSGLEIPPEAEPFIDFFMNAGPALLFILGFFFWLLVAAVFSTIGGLIGGSVFKVAPAPPAPPGTTVDVPPGPEV